MIRAYDSRHAISSGGAKQEKETQEFSRVGARERHQAAEIIDEAVDLRVCDGDLVEAAGVEPTAPFGMVR
jgi:hypothetical protein